MTYLPYIVKALNDRPLVKKLGGLSPNQASSPIKDVAVQRALAERGITPYTEPDWRTQEKNQENYEKSKNPLQRGQLVYKDESKPKLFNKSFYYQVFAF